MQFIHIPRERDLHKKRVAAYCRVSTEKENQEGSLAFQIRRYQTAICARPEWEFAGIYWDEKSGTQTACRPGFQRLIQDALKGKVDYILVKSISRWARNMVDAAHYLQLLQGNGVELFFETEGLDTANPAGSLLFSLLCAIAQDESRSISENVKWSYRKRFQQGAYDPGNHRILGYDSRDGRLLPNQDAETIRRIFTFFLAGSGYAAIARQLKAEGRSGRGGRFLTPKGIKYILGNEVYAGDRQLQKRPPKHYLTKQPDPQARYTSYYLRDDHEGIIPRTVWDEVQKKLKGGA